MLCGSARKTRTKILNHKTAKGSHALMLLDKIEVKATVRKERNVQAVDDSGEIDNLENLSHPVVFLASTIPLTTG